MKKNLYSLVLSENVVAAVDRMAYALHTNRSNLINQILADYVAYETPEKRMQQIFQSMENLMAGGAFQVLQPSASVFQLRSPLAYKYNPTVRYSVEIYREGGPVFGELRVGLRTQNQMLGLYLMQFFKLWSRIEQHYCPGSQSGTEESRFIKKLILQGEAPDAERLARAIAAYVRALDAAMQAFFYQIDRPTAAAAEVEQIYRSYYENTSCLL